MQTTLDDAPPAPRRRLSAAAALPAALVAALMALAACAPRTDVAAMTGYAEADLVYIGPASAGLLDSVAVRRGDAVHRGQLLFRLQAEAETLAAEQALADRDRAQAQAADLRQGRRAPEREAIAAQLAQARAAAVASASALQRRRELVAKGYVAESQLDELVAARDRDAARVRELQAQQRLADGASGRSGEIAAAAAAVRGNDAALALAAWRRSQRDRVAPVDARVDDVMYRPGEWVAAGAPVVALFDPTALKVRFFVAEPELSRVRIGEAVAVSCSGCPAGLRARVGWISSTAEFTPPVIYSAGSRARLVFRVEARPDDGSALKPGQPVDVRFIEPAP